MHEDAPLYAYLGHCRLRCVCTTEVIADAASVEHGRDMRMTFVKKSNEKIFTEPSIATKGSNEHGSPGSRKTG